jgi:outer membrane lipoprotein LolB
VTGGAAAACRGADLVGLALAALCLSLGACATRPADPASETLSGPLSGSLSGRLSVQVEALGVQAARSVSAAFELRGDAERGELQLATPLGTVLATANWSPGRASLATAGGSREFSDLDALAREALGEPLPLRALPDWLRGRPWPGEASRPKPAPGDAGFEQLGWTVNLARFSEGWLLARREAPPAVTLRARLEPLN